MNANEVSKRLYEIGIIPVVVLNDAKDALPLGKALMEGGLTAAEVTFRTDAAEESIRIMVQNFPDMLVGAGTVLTIEQADRAMAAGAKFIVSPGLDPELVDHCIEKGYPVFPGVITPGEIAQAVKRGLTNLKFFPAEAFGGLNTIKNLAAPYPMCKFMPTGGVNPKNVEEYLASPKIFACGGTWMVKADMIKAGEFDKIRDLAKEASEIVKKIRG